MRLRRTRVPSGVASSADRARARRRQRFFFTFREQHYSSESRLASRDTCVLRFRETQIAARPVAVSYATSAVECFVALASYGTQSPKSASRHREKRNRSSNRRLFFLSFPGELFFPSSVSLCEGHFRGGIFARPRVCLRSLEFPRKLSGISLVVATAKQERSVVRALRLIRHALVLLPTLIGAGDTAGGRWH